MDIGEAVFRTIATPNVAYILLILGLFSAVIALAVPGSGFAEVAAGICLILAIIGLAQLDVNLAGVLMIMLGILLFIIDLKLQSGAIAIGGAVALGIGSLFLFQPAPEQMGVSLWLIAIVTLGSAAFFGFALERVVRAMQLRPKVDVKAIIGTQGTIRTPLISSNRFIGIAQIGSELWSVKCDNALAEGTRVVVERIDGLTLYVRQVKE